MPVCPKCKRQYAAAPPVMLPKCPACGFDPSRQTAAPARGTTPPAATGPSVKDQIDRGLQPTASIYRTDPVAREILALAEGEAGLEQKRIKRMLELCLLMHTNAAFIAGLVRTAPLTERGQVVKDIDVQLRKRDPDSQEILGFGYYDKYAREPETLRIHLQEAWEKVKSRWPHMGPHKRKFVAEVFEHDKGYPQSKGSAVNWLAPSQDTLKRSLSAWLGEVRNTDIFTTFSISMPMRNADNITKGWGMSVVDKNKVTRRNADPAQSQYKAMWAEVVNVIAKALDSFDQEKVHEAIKADRENITGEMSACVPKPAVNDFIDRHFDAVWEHLTDPPGGAMLRPEDNKDYRAKLTSFS
jgi:hypothetical protein